MYTIPLYYIKPTLRSTILLYLLIHYLHYMCIYIYMSLEAV